jgi:cupin 2 domain-containing protein
MAKPDGNLLAQLPANLDAEVFETICRSEKVRIERIISRGHTSPASGWYDQEEHEWVAVLQGAATLDFDDGTEVRLCHGDHLNIPAHRKHKVSWTPPDQLTVWLAVFYR